jgi:hypothetical protein
MFRVRAILLVLLFAAMSATPARGQTPGSATRKRAPAPTFPGSPRSRSAEIGKPNSKPTSIAC